MTLLTAVLLASMQASLPDSAANTGSSPPAGREDQFYDLPAQPLADALEAVATRSQISIAFEPGVVSTRRSRRMTGRFPPQIALRGILAGSGLVARFTGPRSAIVYDPKQPSASINAEPANHATGRQAMTFDLAVVRAPQTIGQRDPAAVNAYIHRAESAMRGMFVGDPAYRNMSFQLRIALSVDIQGRIVRATPIRIHGGPVRDDDVARVVLGRDLGVPPAGLRQPLRFDITGQGGHEPRRRMP